MCVWTMAQPEAEADAPCCIDAWFGVRVLDAQRTLGERHAWEQRQLYCRRHTLVWSSGVCSSGFETLAMSCTRLFFCKTSCQG